MSSDASFGLQRREPDEGTVDGRRVAEDRREADNDLAEALMERVSRGESAALGGLMDTYWPGLVQYAASLVGCRDVAEDVAQAVFVQLWQTRSKWTHSGSVAGYLFRVARNLSIGRIRHENVRIRHRSEVERLQPRSRSPLEACEDSEFAVALQHALSTLAVRRREAFELVRFQGLSLDECAEVMGVTRRTVANHVYLATLDLAERLRPFRG